MKKFLLIAIATLILVPAVLYGSAVVKEEFMIGTTVIRKIEFSDETKCVVVLGRDGVAVDCNFK